MWPRSQFFTVKDLFYFKEKYRKLKQGITEKTSEFWVHLLFLSVHLSLNNFHFLTAWNGMEWNCRCWRHWHLCILLGKEWTWLSLRFVSKCNAVDRSNSMRCRSSIIILCNTRFPDAHRPVLEGHVMQPMSFEHRVFWQLSLWELGRSIWRPSVAPWKALQSRRPASSNMGVRYDRLFL